jgi:hypothetical protein
VDLFLDTSVLLSACGSDKGASRFILESAIDYDWNLISAHYCREETFRNLSKLGDNAQDYFERRLDRLVDWQLNALTADDIMVFEKAKDRPSIIANSQQPIRCCATRNCKDNDMTRMARTLGVTPLYLI